MALFRPTYIDPKTGERKTSRVWWFEFTYLGQRIRESAHTTRKTIAEAAEKDRRRSLEEKGAMAPTHREEVRDRTKSVGEALQEYLTAYEGRNKAWAKSVVKRLQAYFGGKRVFDLTEAEVRAYRNSREDAGAAGRTINIECDTLARALGKRFSELWPNLKRKREPKSSGRALNDGEISAILAAAARAPRARYIDTIIRIGLLTGMRSAEIKGLQWGRIDLKRRMIRVGQSKTRAGEGREIPMSDELELLIRAHRGWFVAHFGQPEEAHYVFPACRKTLPADPAKPFQEMKRGWKNVLKAAKVKARFHDLRHTFISRAAEAGTPESVIREIVGHIDREILERYLHPKTDSKRKAIEAVSLANLEGVPQESPKVTPFPGSKRGISRKVKQAVSV